MPYFLEGLIGAIVWSLANAVYIDLRRKGEGGFGRVASFFAGMPLTWIWLFTIPEGQTPRIEPPLDDEDRLLREVRVDRELRERWSAPRHVPVPKQESGEAPGEPPDR